MSDRFSIITPGLATITVTQDAGSDPFDNPRTALAPAEMIIVDTAFGKVEITVCNGAIMTEVFQTITGAHVGPSIFTSLADAFV